MEGIFQKEYTVLAEQTDPSGSLKPSAALYFAQQAAAGHCLLLGADWDTLAKRGLFWAVIRHKLQITRLPHPAERVIVTTWPMPTTRVAYPRCVVARTEDGAELFRLISLWVLMDQKTRQMVLPDKSGVHVEGILLGDELPLPKAAAPKELEEYTVRQVRPEDLDQNGHVNNARYLDWVQELYAPAARGRLREATLCYNQEALEGQQLQLFHGFDEDGVLTVDIRRSAEENAGQKSRIFTARLVFE